jgi:RNA polymerase sigma factor (sigma-70 family)
MVTRMAELQRPSFRLEEYRPYLLTIARIRLYKQPGIASDVVQEALLRAHRKLAQFRGNTKPQRCAWLKTILAHVIADKPSKRPVNGELVHFNDSVRHLESFASQISTPSGIVAKEENLLRLTAALESLLPDEREAVHLRYFHNWKLTDVARQLDRPTTKAVSGLLARGLEKLRHALRDMRDNE